MQSASVTMQHEPWVMMPPGELLATAAFISHVVQPLEGLMAFGTCFVAYRRSGVQAGGFRRVGPSLLPRLGTLHQPLRSLHRRILCMHRGLEHMPRNVIHEGHPRAGGGGGGGGGEWEMRGACSLACPCAWHRPHDIESTFAETPR